jgi:NAD(P)-dependent dehydrogenase (short-subunit alcohol dehydrogenase family)
VAAVTELAARLPDWRCLVNSASVFDYDGVTELDPPTNRAAMQINALAPARLAQAFIAHAVSPAMRCVIHVTDMKIENTNPDFFSYTMSKHALASTIGMLAKGNQNTGVRVYGLAPGAVLASHDQREEETEISHRLNLLQRKTGADEIANAALFLSSGALESGQSLFIDSGQHLLDQPRDVIWLAREEAQSAPGATA